jgi:hypothetical protein
MAPKISVLAPKISVQDTLTKALTKKAFVSTLAGVVDTIVKSSRLKSQVNAIANDEDVIGSIQILKREMADDVDKPAAEAAAAEEGPEKLAKPAAGGLEEPDAAADWMAARGEGGGLGSGEAEKGGCGGGEGGGGCRGGECDGGG